MTIELGPDIENALVEEARRQGTTPEVLVLRYLREHLPESVSHAASQPNASLADFLVSHLGVISSGNLVPGGARMSEQTGKKFAEGMLTKRQHGRL